MSFFNNHAADVVQHFAVVLEFFALILIFTDLGLHRSDRNKGRTLAMATGGLLGRPPDRSARIMWGVGFALAAFFMELYQLFTLYLG